VLFQEIHIGGFFTSATSRKLEDSTTVVKLQIGVSAFYKDFDLGRNSTHLFQFYATLNLDDDLCHITYKIN